MMKVFEFNGQREYLDRRDLGGKASRMRKLRLALEDGNSRTHWFAALRKQWGTSRHAKCRGGWRRVDAPCGGRLAFQ
jgi:hypothetical protein